MAESEPMVTVAVSGGFDPLHVGHLSHFYEAKKLGDRLVVIVNTDEFLRRKKGFVFMPFAERCEIVGAIRVVYSVFPSIDKDQYVAASLARLKPDIFAKGGDRTIDNVPQTEKDACERNGIRLVCGVGGDLTHSSSRMVRRHD